MQNLELNITHLYPDKMNLYGDLGNVITLKQRAEARGIKVTVNNINIDDDLTQFESDLYFMGGGQDKDQMSIYPDIINTKKEHLNKELESGKPMLAICGGYQLLGEYFIDAKGNRIEGLGLLPIETVSPGEGMVNRAVGNLVTEINPTLEFSQKISTLVGFENHSGRTRFRDSEKIIPLGTVRVGSGDNEDQINDGAVYKNTIGSYMHGSLLPKNPHLADYLLEKALEVKYNRKIQLEPIEDKEEKAAHLEILRKYNISN